ncbi:hypothetical protein [Niveispirillum sp. BGYR6]|uniref:hypothetical protein n=1 Tax=Niveispirillum sp. BGYR6 TaxID=2971249 RepID=UPI0022B98A1A|nr:hypothetical protein [Niveispirillum sp. BGYR6]MDG5495832.1 hypothetical protein [Niveispirillum sp. BGYR6]
MAALGFIILNFMLVLTVYNFITKKEDRKSIINGFINQPIQAIFIILWGIFIFMFGWGVLSGGYFSLSLKTPWGKFDTWAIGGIGAFVFFILHIVFDKKR